MSTPALTCSSAASVSSPSMRTAYSRSMPVDGCISLWANSPSLVTMSRPLVLMSSRPTVIQRPRWMEGNPSKTVFRPSGSRREQITPSRLFRTSTRGRGAPPAVRRRPSTAMRSLSATRSPSVAALPLTVMRPARIQRSISRREPRPRAASTLCSFSDTGVLPTAGSVFNGRGSATERRSRGRCPLPLRRPRGPPTPWLRRPRSGRR